MSRDAQSRVPVGISDWRLKETSGLALETFFLQKKELCVQTSCESQTFTEAAHESVCQKKNQKIHISSQYRVRINFVQSPNHSYSIPIYKEVVCRPNHARCQRASPEASFKCDGLKSGALLSPVDARQPVCSFL